MTFAFTLFLTQGEGRPEPRLTATGLYMVAFLRDGETGEKKNSMEGSVVPQTSAVGLVARGPPSIVKQDTNFSSLIL